MKIGEKYFLLDSSEGYGEEVTISRIKEGPFGNGNLFDVKFNNGRILPDVLPSELSNNKPDSIMGYIISLSEYEEYQRLKKLN